MSNNSNFEKKVFLSIISISNCNCFVVGSFGAIVLLGVEGFDVFVWATLMTIGIIFGDLLAYHCFDHMAKPQDQMLLRPGRTGQTQAGPDFVAETFVMCTSAGGGAGNRGICMHL